MSFRPSLYLEVLFMARNHVKSKLECELIILLTNLTLIGREGERFVEWDGDTEVQ